MDAAEHPHEGNVAARAPPAAERGLDALNLFVANIQTGFGPFIAVYLTTQNWTQTAIGFALSLGTITSMLSQVPAGALVDATRHKSRVAAASILAFTASAALFAAQPTPLFVYIAEMLHGFSSCTLGPAIAAMSLIVAGRVHFGLRLGRNARFASIGNGVGGAGAAREPRRAKAPARAAAAFRAGREHPPCAGGSPPADLRRLRHVVHAGQCGAAAAGEHRGHQARRRCGDATHRRLHRVAADHRGLAVAAGGAARRGAR